jgi:signal peptidase II
MAEDRKTMSRAARAALFCCIAVAGVIADQLVKELMRTMLAPGERMTLIPNVMDLVLVENTGAAFSIGEGATWLFSLVAVVVVVYAFVWVLRDDGMRPALVAALACVAGGGAGNLIDRVWRGSVTDFLATTFIDFPVFNVADILVTCGVFVAFLLVVAGESQDGDAHADEGQEGAGRKDQQA